MKLKLELTLNQNGEAAIKGEQLRDEITTQCEDFQIDGWEVASVKLVEGKEHSAGDDIACMVRSLHSIAFLPPDHPWLDNPKYTIRQMADYWLAEIEKMTKKK